MTTNLLIFFAIPLAVIVFSIALQKILKNPFLVAALIFSVLLIIVLAFFDTIYLIAVVAYTILSFITAIITCLICRCSRDSLICNCISNNNNNDDSNADVITISNNGVNLNENGIQNEFSGITGNYTGNCVNNYNRRR